APTEAAHVEWACRAALSRLGVATPGELAQFWNATSIAQAARWCATEAASGGIVAVQVESADNAKPRKAFAVPDWQRRVRRAADAPDRIRLLAPFDPIIRDRKRAQRLFGFDYRFEAFVPAPKRRYGYYVLPLLEGDRLVGRVDPWHDRERSRLVVDRIWWERGIKPTVARKKKLLGALQVLAAQIGASDIKPGFRV
ncbi:MAG TPA: crosslink repair DNA glycosylase YcaQ family protein, partial [Steroidobacteraceae bacterium]|nr:crosslink repair DNA glycosylase YcaQ family protein [Steroidobacteraceae bacterium]